MLKRASCILACIAPALVSAVDLAMSLDMYAGETGYYKIAGYDGYMPEITIALDTDYYFIQSDVTNWMHPIGLAFQPNGAHDVLYAGGDGAPEVADGAGSVGYQYHYLIQKPGETDFTMMTLDDYEPLFFLPLGEWAKYSFKIHFKVTSATFATSIVYFCHIHNAMSGLMTITGGSGGVVTGLDAPVTVSTFDQTCGTYGASDFQSAAACADKQFLCGSGQDSTFAKCMNAIDCKMYVEMQASTLETNYVATFMHQMIPHHQNAVNMAKILLKTSTTYGDNTLGVDIAGAAGEYDGVEDMLLDMVHTQNYQISEMRKWLLENSFALTSSCSRRLDEKTGVRAGGILATGMKRLPSTSRVNKTLRPARAEKASPSRSLQSATWEFSMDLMSGEMGYYKIDGMSGVMPTLTVDIGTTYTLSQAHVTNWMHPIGLAFQPDGAHDVLYAGTNGEGAPEVTDGSATTGYVYMYYVKYPGATTFTAVTLDDYEPLFFMPLSIWATYEFKIEFKVTDASFAKSIVYFCHIHNKMSGLMNIVGGTGSEVANLYTPLVNPQFDTTCGTSGCSDYTTGGSMACTNHQFLCGTVDSSFQQCMNAIDCAMHMQMQTTNTAGNNVASFMQQMIPHHLNAVNMARILLKKSATYGDNTLGVDIAMSAVGEYDGVEEMLLAMVNTQNYQVSEMRKWLLEKGFEITSTCPTPVPTAGSSNTTVSTSGAHRSWSLTFATMAFVGAIAML